MNGQPTDSAEREVVLITGSRTGIGRALVEHFVAQGAIVEGCSRSEPDWTLDGYTHHCLDIVDEDRVRLMVRSISKRHGRLDVLVNNAGIASMNHSLLMPTTAAREILETNFLGAFLVTREATKLMQRRRYGRIISIGSVATALRIEGEAVYAASKSALLTFMQVFAREIAPFGVTCNVVASTPVLTDFIAEVPEERIEQITKQLAIKRLGTVEDILNVVDFFAGRRSDYVTGQVIYLGGA